MPTDESSDKKDRILALQMALMFGVHGEDPMLVIARAKLLCEYFTSSAQEPLQAPPEQPASKISPRTYDEFVEQSLKKFGRVCFRPPGAFRPDDDCSFPAGSGLHSGSRTTDKETPASDPSSSAPKSVDRDPWNPSRFCV